MENPTQGPEVVAHEAAPAPVFRPWWELAIAGALFVAIAVAMAAGWFEDIENRSVDYRFRWRGSIPESRGLVLVSITDDCLVRLGQWPWPRATHARLLNVLKRAGARVVAFDLMFAEPSSQGPDDDVAFARMLGDAGNVILPVSFGRREVLTPDLETVEQMTVEGALPLFRGNLAGEGFIDMEHVRTNRDGVIRDLIPGKSFEGRQYFVLGLVVAAKLLDLPVVPGPDGVRIGSMSLPVYHRQYLGDTHAEPLATYLLNYVGPGARFDDISYYDTLTEKFNHDLFRGKAVIVGTRARGTNEDVKFSPFGAMAGMEVHANLVHNLITGRIMQRPSQMQTFVGMVLLALLLALFMSAFQGIGGNLVAIGVLPGYVAVSLWAFTQDVTLAVVPVLVLVGAEVVAIRFAQLILNLKRSRDDLAKRVRELSLLNEVSKSTSYIGDLNRTLSTVLSRAVQGLQAERGSLFLLDSQYENLTEQSVVVGDGADETPDSRLADRFKLGEGIAGGVFSSGKPELIRDTRRDSRFKTYSDRDRRIRSLICVPLVVKSGAIGVMNIVNKRSGEFDQEDLNLTLTMANQAAVLIDNARLFNLATIDGLTGLVVHRHFQAKLEEEFRRSTRYEKPLSLILTDIDHFKKFNDTWGHQTGDMVLREVAKIVRNSTRDTDIAARYGGEEFGVILPETDVDGARLFAERVRQRVEAGEFPGPGGKLLKVTISIGVCAVPHHTVANTQEMIRLADEGLYESKHNGRNRVSVVEQSAESAGKPVAPAAH